MFEKFPFLLGKKLNYHQYFSLTSMLVFFAFALAFFILSCFFKKLEEYFTMRKLLQGMKRDEHIEDPSQPILPESVVSSDKFKFTGRHVDFNGKETNNYQSEPKQEAFGNATYQRSKMVKTLYWISYFFKLLCTVCLSFTPLCWSAFGKLPIAAAIFLLLFIYYFRFFSDVMDFRPNSVKQLKNKDHENAFLFNLKKFARINIVTCRRFKIFYIGANVLIIFFSIFLPFLFENSCVTFHNPKIGFSLGSADLSTKITRQTSENEKCPAGVPCHVYATLPENTTNSVFLNFHTNQKHGDAQVFNDSLEHYTVQKTLRYKIEVKRFDPELESIGSRYVYSALITDLQPNSSYVFGIFYDNTYQTIKFYNTMPEYLSSNDSIAFANGGDVGSSDIVQSIANGLIPHLPNIVFIGGDTVYDNGLKTCYHAWDSFLSMIDTLSISINRLVPVVLAVGNHDVGLNSLSQTNISLKTKDAPLIFQYFPQHYQRNNQGNLTNKVPEIHERRSFFYHTFAGMIFFTLDSGYINTVRGYQSIWLNESLNENNNLLKFAHYHAPSFPSCSLDNNIDKTANVETLMFWNNLFDKYNFTTVYENHYHLLKRTWRLKGNVENENGTIYLGDGGWGDVNDKCAFNDEEFYANILRKQHVWVSKVTNTHINFTAIGPNGTIYDHVSEKLNLY